MGKLLQIPVVAFSARCDSTDAVEDFFSKQWGQVHRLSRQEGLTFWHSDFFHFAGMTLLSARSDGAYSFDTEIPSQNVQIVIPKSDCHSLTRAGHLTYHCRLGHGTIIDMRQVTRGQTSGNWSDIQLSIPYPMIERAVGNNLGYQVKNRVMFEPVFSLLDPRHQFFADFLQNLFETTSRSNDFALSPIAISSTTDAIINYIVHFFIHNYSDAFQAQKPSAELSRLSRAVDFMHAHLKDPIVVEDIANAVDVSVRSLQLWFRQHYGCTPMQYLRRLRLLRVHEEIKASGAQANARRIALRWGFVHWRLFKSYYRAEFGSDP